MSNAQKIVSLFIGLGMVTTLVLPGRQTPQVVDAFARLGRGMLATAMGTGKAV